MKIFTAAVYMMLPSEGVYLVWLESGIAVFDDDTKGESGVEYVPKHWYFIDKDEDGTT